MADAKKKSSALARLTPNSIDMKVDGHDVRVATDAAENRIMNMVLASQMRHVMQQSLKKMQDQEILPTPKELRDMAEAAKSIASFSAEVYSVGEGIDPSKPEPKGEEQQVSEETDFSALIKPKLPEVTEVETTIE